MKQSRFSQTAYHCEICMSSIKGARCILLSCSHVFCRSCLEDFWRLSITEGDIGRVGCPDVNCVKEGREAKEEEVRRAITEEELRRWKWLRQKRLFDRGKPSEVTALFQQKLDLGIADPSIVHCPLSFCQAPVLKPDDAEEGTGWERLRTCQECGYSFCVYCRRTW